ncbi:MAG: alpha/beta fold hydrolase, partial [Rhizobiaceae bacterium]
LELIDATPQILGIMAFGAAPAPNGPFGLIQAMHFSKTLLLAGKAEFSTSDAQYFEEACFGTFADLQFVDTLKRTDKRMRPSVVRNILYGYGMSQKARLEASATPVCLLHGRNEPLIRTSYMESLSNPMLYTGKSIIIENSGHAPFVDAQPEFDRVLKDFADAVTSGTMHRNLPALVNAA